ncbi:MAG TPA: hypothetical protein VGN07_16620 [Steroidobacteraceae bacterium]|jgi:uncharacterized peroxidase-related enzyme
MPFIDTIPDSDIDADVRAMYERQRAHWGFVPNYAKVFCYRPEIMRLWAQLQLGIKQHMDKRRFELVTFASAHELRSTLCSLAHGKALTEFVSMEDVQSIAKGDAPASLSAAEAQMLVFARQVARDASAVTRSDIERLKQHGFSDAEIFDIAATAAARSFWTKVIESLGVEPEPTFLSMNSEFVEALTAGRPLEFAEPNAA